MDISRNTTTGEIQRGDLGDFFRQGDWIDCIDRTTGNIKPEEQPFIDAWDLQQAKDNKLAELKKIRDESNILPIDDLQGYEIVDDLKTETLVTFRFLTASTNNTATDPNNLLFKVMLTAASDPSYYLSYSCLIFNKDGSTRKGYVSIDGALANSLANHFSIRSTNNIKVVNNIKKQILAATSLSELGDVDIQYNENLTRFLSSSSLNPVS